MMFFRCAAVATLLLLGACSSLPQFPSLPGFDLSGSVAATESAGDSGSVGASPSPSTSPREQIDRAVRLLGAGRADEARSLLSLALVKSPNDKSAIALMAQIDGDPIKLLGRDHQLYTVAPGDTMSGLAERHLGDPLKFYALSRYNDLQSPDALRVGARLKIPVSPGSAIVSAPVRAENMIEPKKVDVESASAMRLRGLEALNKGEVRLAVDLLRRAEALNSGDPAIQRDLERALRIQASLADDR